MPSLFEAYGITDPVQPEQPPAPQPRGIGGTLKDAGISALKGAIDVPEAAVGLADLVTGGYAGKAAQAAGFRPAEAKAMLDEGYSEQQKQAFQNVQAAHGVMDTLSAVAQNPSVVAHSIIESLPSMGAGGVIGRGAVAVAPRLISPVLGGAIGEGAVQAGQAGEQIRQENPDGLLTGKQAGLAAASGAFDTLISLGGGKLAQRLGISDIDTLLAGGHASPEATKGLVRRVIEGAASEGLLEELPQSIQEQVLQNVAQGKPMDDGVDQNAILGMLSGMAMGGAANVLHSAPKLPDTGPMSRAANAAAPAAPVAAGAGIDPGLEGAAAVSAGAGAAAAPAPATQQPMEDPVLARINTLQGADRSEALAAYNILNREDAPKGVRQYNSRLLDDLLAKLDQTPVESTDPAALLSQGMNRDPLQGAMAQQRDEATAQANLDQWMARAPAMPLQRAQEMKSEADAQGMALTVVPHGAGQGFTLVPDAWITPAMRNQVATALPLATEPTGVVRADAQGNAAPETRAQAIDTAQAAAAQAAERQRKNALGLTPDVEAVQAGKKREPLPTVQQGDMTLKSGQPFKNKGAAVRAQKAAGGGDVVQVQGGWVVRTQAAAPAVQQEREAGNVGSGDATVAAAPADGGSGRDDAGAGRGDSTAAGGDALRGVDHPAGSPAAASAQGAPVRDAGGESAAAVAERPDEKTAPGGERWTSADDAERERLLSAAGWKQGSPGTEKMKAQAWEKMTQGQRNRIAKALETAAPVAPARETITPANDTHIGKNADGEDLHEREDGSRYRMHNGRPDFGGDLAPYTAVQATKEEPTHEDHADRTGGEGGVQPQADAAAAGGAADVRNGESAKVEEPAARAAAPANTSSVEDQVSEMLDPEHPRREVVIPAEEDIPESVMRAQTDRRKAPGYSMITRPDGTVVLTSDTKAAPAHAAAQEVSKAPEAAKEKAPAQDDETPPAITEAQARKQLEWRYLGQKDGVKTHALFFFEKPEDKGTGQAMGYGKIERYEGASGWSVQDGDGKTYRELADAKRAAEDAAIVRLRDNGYVKGSQEPVAADKTPPKAATGTIQDTGEKIGGSRKDRWAARGLNVADLDEMSDTEGAQLAVKKNVWAPDYEAIAKDADPVTAAMVKVVYDSLAAKPKVDTPQGRRDYVKAMQAVRKVYGAVKTVDEAKNAYLKVRAEFGVVQNAATTPEGKEARRVMFSVYKGRSDPFVFDYNALSRAKSLVKDGFPSIDPWKRRLAVRGFDGTNITAGGLKTYLQQSAELGTPLTEEQLRGTFYRVSDLKGKALGYFASKEDAEGAARTIYERDFKGGKDDKPEPERPHLDEMKREGLPQRIDRDVSADDFMKQFGFRGVEFGNWSAQDERQRILNMAYDGLADLAEIMGVPPQAMSLNGTLGMAFGARGGGRFAAHYEPGKLVINMTKLRGGGSMAHEWAHALDHYLGELEQPDAYKGKARGASGWYEEGQYNGMPRTRMAQQADGSYKKTEQARLPNLRPELARAIDRVMSNLFQAQVTKEELLRDLRSQLANTEKMQAQEADPQLKAMYGRAVENQRSNIAEVEKDPDDKTYPRKRSEYFNEAQKLSGKSEKGYWVRPTEMFARAFESWVHDRIVAMGARSDYLVHGVEETRFAGGGYKGNPYPVGKERAQIDAAFDNLTKTIQTKETDKGVAMFSRSMNDVLAKDLDTRKEAIQQLVDSISKRWANAPEIVVVRDMQDPKVPQKVRDTDAAQRSQGADSVVHGFHYQGKVYLVAEGISDPQQAMETLAHEVLGHAGLQGFFGDALQPIKQQIVAMRKKEVLAKAADYGMPVTREAVRAELGKTATDADVQRVVNTRLLYAAEEVLAEFAQQQPQLGFVKRAVAAIRTWLRENVPGFKNLELSDEEIIRSYILPARGWIERGEGTGATKGGEAQFSRASTDHALKEAVLKNGFQYDQKRLTRIHGDGMLAATLGKQQWPVLVMRGNFGREQYRAALAEAKARGLSTDKMIVFADLAPYLPKGVQFTKLDEVPGAQPPEQPPEQQALFSRSAAGTIPATEQPMHRAIMQSMNDTFSAPGKLSWWHKTIGTQYNLAQRSPEYKRVFDGVQDFINDVSQYATQAADMAPKILPKLETWKDIGKAPIAPADNKAISAPIFEGTLTWARDERGRPVKIDELRTQAQGLSAEAKAQRMLRSGAISENVLKMWKGLPLEQYEQAVATRFDSQMLRAGVVWSDDELRSQFHLTDGQIALYHEFRNSVDRSITNMAVSDMVRFGGKDVEAVRQDALEAGDVDAAALILRDHLLQLAEKDPARNDLLIDTAERMIDKADRARELMDRGYAPLSRFGHHTVDVIDEHGERVYFGMFETPREAALMARKMKGNFPQANVTRGTVSQEEYKLFAGVSPETVELFGELLGLEAQGDNESSKAFQTYIKVAKANRSAMKRLIERKGIAGFSEDVGRVLAGFVYSNARQTSQNLHMGEMTNAASEVSKGQGELKDQATKLVEYVKNPQEEAQGLRGMLFGQYLAGSIAGAAVNMMQPVQVTFPYLSQFGGIVKAASRMTKAFADAGKKTTGDPALDAALKHAEEEGIVAPQEVHQLMAQAGGRAVLTSGDGTVLGNARATASNSLSRLRMALGKVFGAAEQMNRRVTFIAAYRTAVAEGIADPAKFAEKAIAETQFIYNKGNKANWARGAIGGTLFAFKSYSVSYIELLHRMATQGGPEGKKAVVLALGMLFLFGGAGGLPFADDLDDVVDGVMQRLGYNFSSKLAKRQFFEKYLGKQLGGFAESGISGLPGSPIDVSGRLGMGNLIPGTGLLVDKQDHTKDVSEIAGAAGDFATRLASGANKLVQGDVRGAAQQVAPRFAANAMKGYEMYTTGQYKDANGKKVIDTDGYDALAKTIGFQPNDVADVQQSASIQQGLIAEAKLVSTRFSDQWAKAIVDGDQGALADVRERIRQWNIDNPDSQVVINRSAIAARVKAMREDKNTRLEHSAPKSMRANVRQALSEANQ